MAKASGLLFLMDDGLRKSAAVEYLFAASDDLPRSVFLFIGEWASESGVCVAHGSLRNSRSTVNQFIKLIRTKSSNSSKNEI